MDLRSEEEGRIGEVVLLIGRRLGKVEHKL